MEATLAPVVHVKEAQRLRMTYEEFLAWSDEDKHAEWVNGEVIVQMPPVIRHQQVAGFLLTLLRLFADFFRRGMVLPAPTEMKLSPGGSAREPDIIFIARENLGRLSRARLNGPADLVVEFISDESVTRDRADKFYEYQAAGVREYWLIDPRPGTERADFWTLDADGRFRPVLLDDEGIYHSIVLSGFWLRVEWLFQEELPDPQLTFAEIAGFPPETIATLRKLADNHA